MTDYSRIDPILNEWAKKHGLRIFTQYKDEEVRATDIVDDTGDIYGVYITPSANDRFTMIAAGRQRRSPSTRRTCAVEDLAENLDAIYGEIETWIRARGKTRTPVI